MFIDNCSLCHVRGIPERIRESVALIPGHQEPFLLRGAKIRHFSDTTKFRMAIRPDFQQSLILNLVNKANS